MRKAMTRTSNELFHRLCEYRNNPHHINPMSQAMHQLLAEIVEHLAVEKSWEDDFSAQRQTIEHLTGVVEKVKSAASRGFVTCVTGDGKPYVKVSFNTLIEAQNYHANLVSPNAPYGAALIGQSAPTPFEGDGKYLYDDMPTKAEAE